MNKYINIFSFTLLSNIIDFCKVIFIVKLHLVLLFFLALNNTIKLNDMSSFSHKGELTFQLRNLSLPGHCYKTGLGNYKKNRVSTLINEQYLYRFTF